MKENKMIFYKYKTISKDLHKPDSHFIDCRLFDFMCAAFGAEQSDATTRPAINTYSYR